MSDAEEVVGVRKTRSGRSVKTPVKAKSPSKQTGRKTRKKVVMMEVEVTDDEETEQGEQNDKSLAKKAKLEEIQEETTVKSEASENTDILEETKENITPVLPVEEEVLECQKEPVENGDTIETDKHNDTEPSNEAEEDNIEKQENGALETNTEEIEEVHKEEEIHKDEETSNINMDCAEIEMPPTEEEETEEVTMDTVEEDKTDKEPDINGDPGAENISDEELPGVPVAKVPETEEVSDEELPGPKRAELPADTEVVSEDELPTSKKEPDDEEGEKQKTSVKRKCSEGDYDPTSPTSENESAPKKVKEEKEEKEKEGSDHGKSSKPKKLPELDKYWKAVNDDPTDFTGWTYLLQYVDQEHDTEAAREAYDAFLSHYPYCYGYWRKYADYEKKKGSKKKCEEVFERGLKAIPLSVDLWIHYLTYVKATRGDDDEYVRSQFERAVAVCGLEFRSDRLWESYIKWETEGKRLQRVTSIYERLLASPTQGYTVHFDNFQEHVSSNAPNKVLDVDEFIALRKEVRNMLKHGNVENVVENASLPPGDEDSKLSDEETKAIRERIVSIRRKIHKNTLSAITARWNFEEGIKRPYFHVKPLERCQLKNWQDYLDFEIKSGDQVRTIVLFERCLIACALYEEYWLKFVHYLESLKDPDMLPKIRDVYERACTIHHLKKPNLHLQWAIFEEANGNAGRAAEILVNLEKQVPNVLQVAYRRINLERRRGDFDKCIQLFEHYITSSKNKIISSNVAIKYARFCLKVLKDYEKARETLKAAIVKDPNNPRLYLQLIDLVLQRDDVQEEDVCAIIDEFLEKEAADAEQKVLFAQRKLEYLEDFGAEVQALQQAYEQYQKYVKLSKENPKKKESKSESSSSKKDKDKSSSSTSQAAQYGCSYGSSSSQSAAYPYSSSQQGQYSYAQYGQGDQYQYQNWQYPQGSYSGYNQWGYGGSYNY
ncbi:pre-mRNA processing factor 39 isoform X2 [Rhynchophorus ferrugineus]|uniref:pre-mRNA processing factor 39 isoform X2 n=1 Tax=Rhynchophorus ferrugineus TaxID=354439 RepID=UPI003FCC8C11